MNINLLFFYNKVLLDFNQNYIFFYLLNDLNYLFYSILHS